tara:strand:- start:62 stop:178 length:117 start_codon:yes stop_codon:yes gene_type:complete
MPVDVAPGKTDKAFALAHDRFGTTRRPAPGKIRIFYEL